MKAMILSALMSYLMIEMDNRSIDYIQFDGFQKSMFPTMAYISHDGDEAVRKHVMINVLLRHKKAPLHPEAALNMYLVSNAHKGHKKKVIEDCLSLITLCDDFWIMSPQPIRDADDFLHFLPEGVISEALWWMQYTKKPVQIFNMQKDENYAGFSFDTNTPVPFMMKETTATIIRLLQKNNLSAIAKFLQNKPQDLRPTAYILLMNISELKNIGWIKDDIYNSQRVPVFPYDQISEFQKDMANMDDKTYRIFRITYALKAQELWIYGLSQTLDLREFSDDSLKDLSLILRVRPDIRIIYKSLYETTIPKYSKKWSITEREKRELK